MAKVEYRKLSQHTGAEILGLDLRQQIPQETIQEIWNIFVDHCVVLFRGQTLEQADLVRATGQFGACGEYDRPAAFHTSGQKKVLPQIMLITNIRENGEPIGSLPDGEMWFHHDTIHRQIPHKATLLYSVEIPSWGGNTVFSNLMAAYDELPADLKTALEGRKVYNAFSYGSVKKNDPNAVKAQQPRGASRDPHLPRQRAQGDLHRPADEPAHRRHARGAERGGTQPRVRFHRAGPVLLRSRVEEGRRADVGQPHLACTRDAISRPIRCA